MILSRPRVLALAVLIAGCACGLRGCVPEDVTLNGDITPVRVEFDAKTTGDHVDVEYWVTNQTAAPILLLDRMRDWKTEPDEQHPVVLDPGWAYVEIIEGLFANKAVLSRRLIDYDAGWIMEGAEVPYGRRINAGQTVSGKFQVRLPLMEMTSCNDEARKPADRQAADFSRRVSVRYVEFRVGWSPELPIEAHTEYFGAFDVDGYVTWNLTSGSHGWLRARQRVSKATARPVRWEGLLSPRETSVNAVRSSR